MIFCQKKLKTILRASFLTNYTCFISNSISHVCLRLLREDANFRLNAAKKLLTRSGSNILKKFLNEQMIREKTTKLFFFVSDDGYRTFYRPCMDNTIDSKVRFYIRFFANKNFFTVFLEDHILLVPLI